MSQKYRILERLQQGPCSNMEFIYDLGIPRFGARIFELNQTHLRAFRRKLIEKRPGPGHNIEVWFLADEPATQNPENSFPVREAENGQLEMVI